MLYITIVTMYWVVSGFTTLNILHTLASANSLYLVYIHECKVHTHPLDPDQELAGARSALVAVGHVA